MKKIILVIIISNFIQISFGQTYYELASLPAIEIKHIEAFTHPIEINHKVSIYHAPHMYYKELHSDNESGWIVTVKQKKLNYFQIDIEDLELNSVWIRAGDIGVVVQNDDSIALPIYAVPDTNTQVIKNIYRSCIGLVYDVKNDFLFLQIILDSGRIWGWVERKYLSVTPYTTTVSVGQLKYDDADTAYSLETNMAEHVFCNRYTNRIVCAYTHPLGSNYNVSLYHAPNKYYKEQQSDIEAGWTISIIQKKLNYFQININVTPRFSPSDREFKDYPSETVWIHTGNIGIGIQKYGSTSVPIFAKPDTNSLVIERIYRMALGLVFDINNGFFLLKIFTDDGFTWGWVESKYLCSSQYAPCN